MHQSINISNDSWSLAPFADAAALERFYRQYGCDGVELILCGEDFTKLRPGMVRGLHMIFYPEWICLWTNDFAYMDREFGSRAAWQAFYSAKDKNGLLATYRREWALAKQLGAEYVVFHMGDNAMPEYYTMQARHPEEYQVDQSIDFLNTLLEGEADGPWLLLENMWLGCMNLTRPALTHRALAGVRYPKTGLMLDTGHLMSTHPDLREPEAACAYIHQVLDAHGDEVVDRIKGVHLHASLSGEYRSTLPLPAPDFAGMDYIKQYSLTNAHLRQVDRHRPFTAKGMPALVRRIAPDYLTHELARTDHANWQEMLAAQTAALGEG